MAMYLLDTNIISEVVKEFPETKVLDFLTDIEDAYLSVVTVHELYYGVRRLPEGKKRKLITTGVDNLLKAYEQKTLDVGVVEMDLAATLRVEAQQQGKVLHLADSLIAATAKQHNLILATRNISDFDSLKLALINPWQ